MSYASAIDCEGRAIWIAQAYRDDGKRFIVRADEKLTAFLELEAEIYGDRDDQFAQLWADDQAFP